MIECSSHFQSCTSPPFSAPVIKQALRRLLLLLKKDEGPAKLQSLSEAHQAPAVTQVIPILKCGKIFACEAPSSIAAA
jgi:hypothetical protein